MKRTYTTKEWLNTINYINRFKVIPKRNNLLIVIGSFLLGFGFITLPIPTGSFLFIGIGSLILSKQGIEKKHILKNIEDFKFNIKDKFKRI